VISKQGIQQLSGVVDPTTLEIIEQGTQARMQTKNSVELTGSPENCTVFDYKVGMTKARVVLPGGIEV